MEVINPADAGNYNNGMDEEGETVVMFEEGVMAEEELRANDEQVAPPVMMLRRSYLQLGLHCVLMKTIHNATVTVTTI